jgi:hypothetical protein
MALFNECGQSCAHIVLDIADIVRDGDLSPTKHSLTGLEGHGPKSHSIQFDSCCRVHS